MCGLGLLNAVTVFALAKQTSQVRAVFCEGSGLLAGLAGVEIGANETHMGRTEVRESPLVRIREGTARIPPPMAPSATTVELSEPTCMACLTIRACEPLSAPGLAQNR